MGSKTLILGSPGGNRQPHKPLRCRPREALVGAEKWDPTSVYTPCGFMGQGWGDLSDPKWDPRHMINPLRQMTSVSMCICASNLPEGQTPNMSTLIASKLR